MCRLKLTAVSESEQILEDAPAAEAETRGKVAAGGLASRSTLGCVTNKKRRRCNEQRQYCIVSGSNEGDTKKQKNK